MASELDSFDGRAEPERCSRLVGKLRTGQEQVLGITNLIMDELLGDERASRAFRAKFPEEVLQESLAGQLWFGAECLAAGSSILNREQESAEMRPLAKAVTKSLDNVRNLLREQCLRNNTPNSPRLNLNFNDAATEQLCESLKIFDKLFADFELRYVSAMVTVKTKQEHETQEMICVLFSETVHRALKLDLLDQEQVDSFDPALMFSIPRLAIVAGLVIFPDGPLNMDVNDGQLSELFRPFRVLLLKIRELLRSLNKDQLRQLERLLCTNEDMTSAPAYSQERSGILGRNTREASGAEQWHTAAVMSDNSNRTVEAETDRRVGDEDELPTLFEAMRSFGFEEEEEDVDTPEAVVDVEGESSGGGGGGQQIDVINDCASGYLIPNTNLGYLLQPTTTEAPLTDSFISTEDEGTPHNNVAVEDEDDADDDDDREQVTLNLSSEDDSDVESRGRLLNHFMDTVSTKSSSSGTSSTGTVSSTNSVSTESNSSTVATTTGTATAEKDPASASLKRSQSVSSSDSSTSSSSSTTTTTSTSTTSDFKSLPNTPKEKSKTTTTTATNNNTTSTTTTDSSTKCLLETNTSARDSGLCTSEDRSPENELVVATAVTGGEAEPRDVRIIRRRSNRVAKERDRESDRHQHEEEDGEGHRVLCRRYATNWESLQNSSGGGDQQRERERSGRNRGGDVAGCSSGRRRREGGSSGQHSRRKHQHHHSSSGSYLRRCVAYPSTSEGGSGSAARRISNEDQMDMARGFKDDQVSPEMAESIMDATK